MVSRARCLAVAFIPFLPLHALLRLVFFACMNPGNAVARGMEVSLHGCEHGDEIHCVRGESGFGGPGGLWKVGKAPQ